jgi:catechol 2,3-dioxygenase-like lactoylglutathione lyase family enzyme
MADLPPPFAEQITFVFVSDLDRSHAFYCEVLGLPLALDQGSCRIYRITGTAYLGVCARPEEVSPGGIILTLITDEVDRWHERLVAASVPVIRGPGYSEQYRVYHAFYQDPDGYLVETQQFRDAAWEARPAPRNPTEPA